MADVLSWLTSHPGQAVAAGYGVLNLLNGLLGKRRGWAGGALDKAHLALDFACLLTRRDAPGTVKVPGRRSR